MNQASHIFLIGVNTVKVGNKCTKCTKCIIPNGAEKKHVNSEHRYFNYST